MIKSINGILGLAIGDAMGVPNEFCNRESLIKEPVTTMLGYKSHPVPEGTWSDDTSMTLATIDSIIQKRKIDYNDIAHNFLLWYKNAKYTATNEVFDIGTTCLQAIVRYEAGLDVAEKCGGITEMENGNGSLMRILPIAYYCYSKKLSEAEIFNIVKNVSSITHANEISVLGCYIYVMYAIELLEGKSKDEAYKYIQEKDYSVFFCENAILRYSRIIREKIYEYDLQKISSSGYVVATLEATLWVIHKTNSYNESIIGAINLGDDTDTVGACVGGLAGIIYGEESINQEWKENLKKENYIEELCNNFDRFLN